MKHQLWQLTRNYRASDGTEIGTIRVFNLDGIDCSTADVLLTPHLSSLHQC